LNVRIFRNVKCLAVSESFQEVFEKESIYNDFLVDTVDQCRIIFDDRCDISYVDSNNIMHLCKQDIDDLVNILPQILDSLGNKTEEEIEDIFLKLVITLSADENSVH